MFPDFVFFPLWSSLITGCDLALFGLLTLNILFKLAEELFVTAFLARLS